MMRKFETFKTNLFYCVLSGGLEWKLFPFQIQTNIIMLIIAQFYSIYVLSSSDLSEHEHPPSIYVSLILYFVSL